MLADTRYNRRETRYKRQATRYQMQDMLRSSAKSIIRGSNMLIELSMSAKHLHRGLLESRYLRDLCIVISLKQSRSRVSFSGYEKPSIVFRRSIDSWRIDGAICAINYIYIYILVCSLNLRLTCKCHLNRTEPHKYFFSIWHKKFRWP